MTALVQIEQQYDAAIANARWVLQRDPAFPLPDSRSRAGVVPTLHGAPRFEKERWSYSGRIGRRHRAS